jgi:hypothetical protein
MAAAESAYVAKDSFASWNEAGMPRVINKGDMVQADDPLVARGAPTRPLFEPVSDFIRTQTAPIPTIRPEPEVVEPEITSSRRSRRGQPKENEMPHTLPPEDPESPASPFAPLQPAAGVVADDVDDGGTKAADWSPDEKPVDPKPAKASGDTAKK